MKNIISYVLFNQRPKYWKLIPLIYMANRMLKPDLIMRWQVAQNSLETPGWPLLQKLEQKSNGFLELQVVTRPHRNHEAAAWRMFPFWDPEVDYMYLRDSDSLPCSYELKAERVFLESDLWVHGMRAHPHHVDDLIASVTIFRCSKLRARGPKSYEEFQTLGANFDWSHWAEQYCMKNFFIHFRAQTLISVSGGASPPGDHPRLGMPVMFPDEKYNAVDLSDVNQKMLEICDEISLFPSGQIYTSPNHLEKVYGKGDHVIGIRIKPDLILEQALAIEDEAARTLRHIFENDGNLKDAFWKP